MSTSLYNSYLGDLHHVFKKEECSYSIFCWHISSMPVICMMRISSPGFRLTFFRKDTFIFLQFANVLRYQLGHLGLEAAHVVMKGALFVQGWIAFLGIASCERGVMCCSIC